MKYRVQVHFDNQGQMEWLKDFPDEDCAYTYIVDITKGESLIEWDEVNKRWLFANMNRVLAVFVQEIPEATTEEVICP